MVESKNAARSISCSVSNGTGVIKKSKANALTKQCNSNLKGLNDASV